MKLALEIADILDELNSIDRLFVEQADALAELARNVQMHDGVFFGTLASKVRGLIERDIGGYRKQVGRMMEDARRTKDTVSSLSRSAIG